ncbi:unnamed protein product [Alopecurus aequalis]
MRAYKRCATVAPPSSSPPWASLPGDLVQQIAWRVLAGELHGYVRFRAVCTRWRSGTVRPHGRGVTDQRFHPRRWTMLSVGQPGHGRKLTIRFFNLDTAIYVRVKLPLLRNHRVLDSVDGLLLLVRVRDTAVRLLNPFTGDIAELPPLATLLTQGDIPDLGQPDERSRWFSITYNISATVSHDAAGITTVMLAFPCLARVAVATSNDRQWTMSSWKFPIDVERISFRGNLYMVRNPSPTISQIFQIDPHVKAVGTRQPSPPWLVATCPPDILSSYIHLVDCDSEEIFVVGCSNICYSRILVYQLADLMLGRLLPITSIGERAIFMEERTMCVSSKMLPTVMAGTVVYTDRREDRREESGYYARYHLLTGTRSRVVEPGPSSLNCNAMSCSMRNLWNKSWMTFSITGHQKHGCLLWMVERLFCY